jgi:hypothetical protein
MQPAAWPPGASPPCRPPAAAAAITSMSAHSRCVASGPRSDSRYSLAGCSGIDNTRKTPVKGGKQRRLTRPLPGDGPQLRGHGKSYDSGRRAHVRGRALPTASGPAATCCRGPRCNRCLHRATTPAGPQPGLSSTCTSATGDWAPADAHARGWGPRARLTVLLDRHVG